MEWLRLLRLDAVPLLTALCAALPCAAVGNFLVLRREALQVEAMSHAAVPGVVLAAAFSAGLAALPLLGGALAAMAAALVAIAALRALFPADSGAVIGAVLALFFAAGLILVEQLGAGGNRALSVDTILFGTLEATVWWGAAPPPALMAAAFVALSTAAVMPPLFRAWQCIAFDREAALAAGLPVAVLDAGLLLLTAVTVAAAFQAVGAVMVLGMVVAPPAAARLLSRRLPGQLTLSLGIAALSTLVGYAAAVYLPLAAGLGFSLSGAAGIVVMATALFVATVVVKRWCRRRAGPRRGSC